jgi:Lon protease-like protein
MSATDQKIIADIPMFPLRDFYLFPGAVVPLHIFEPRYRQMIDDLLDAPGRLVMASVRPEHADRMEGAPPVLPIGGLGEIVHHKKLADGRFLIWLMGLGRVEIEEVASRRLYRKVNARLLDDEIGDADANRDLAPRLVEAIAHHEQKEIEVSEDLPVGLLADILLQNLQLRAGQLQEAFQERNMTRRAGMALGWHRLQVDYRIDEEA